jgi:hypothetical protein
VSGALLGCFRDAGIPLAPSVLSACLPVCLSVCSVLYVGVPEAPATTRPAVARAGEALVSHPMQALPHLVDKVVLACCCLTRLPPLQPSTHRVQRMLGRGGGSSSQDQLQNPAAAAATATATATVTTSSAAGAAATAAAKAATAATAALAGAGSGTGSGSVTEVSHAPDASTPMPHGMPVSNYPTALIHPVTVYYVWGATLCMWVLHDRLLRPLFGSGGDLPAGASPAAAAAAGKQQQSSKSE